jgi:hypothetical protein
VVRHVDDCARNFEVAVIVGIGAAACGHRALAVERVVQKRVVTFADARRPCARIAEFGRTGRAARVTRRADGLEDFFAGFIDARGVGVADIDLCRRRDALLDRLLDVRARTRARRVVHVHRKQDDDGDRNAEPRDDRRDELAGCFDRGSVRCFAHACLVSRF